jgi:homoserine dehydrogenase
LMEENILVGHGAGALPTGAAVVGDVMEIVRNSLIGTGTRVPAQSFQKTTPIPLKNMGEIEAEYFLRFRVKDVPGVLAKLSGILGDHSISIESMIQRGRDDNGKGVPLVMMIHRSNEKNVQDALTEIDRLDVVCEKSNLIRVEN